LLTKKKVCFGKPVIKGTRVPVVVVSHESANGLSHEEIAEEYGITVEDVRAAVRYAVAIVANETIYDYWAVMWRFFRFGNPKTTSRAIVGGRFSHCGVGAH